MTCSWVHVRPARRLMPAVSKLLLVHGYCSGGVWPTSNFTEYSVLGLQSNRSHDTFATLIPRSRGRNSRPWRCRPQSGRCGQLAFVHILLEWSRLFIRSRLIQSVGAVSGTALAGNLALLGPNLWYRLRHELGFDL